MLSDFINIVWVISCIGDVVFKIDTFSWSMHDNRWEGEHEEEKGRKEEQEKETEGKDKEKEKEKEKVKAPSSEKVKAACHKCWRTFFMIIFTLQY